MNTTHFAERRAFLKLLTTTTAALAMGGCGGGGASLTESAAGADGAADLTPAWNPVPTIMFAQGVASSISIAAYVTDPVGGGLIITKNPVVLPPGVTYDSANKRFVYDGVGGVGIANGNVLIADDGQP